MTETIREENYTDLSTAGNLKWWLDSRKKSTQVLDSNGNVITWNDRTSSGYNVTNGTEAERPTPVQGMNNWNSIEYNGGQGLSYNPADFQTQATMFFVFQRGVIESGIDGIFGSGDAESEFNSFDVYTNSQSFYIKYRSSTGSAGSGGVFLENLNPHLFAVVMDGTTIKTYIDGTLSKDLSPAGGFTPNFRKLKLGENREDGNSWKGYINEVLLYDKAFDSTERAEVTNMALNKWGI